VGPRAGLDAVAKREKFLSLPPPGIEVGKYGVEFLIEIFVIFLCLAW
jgi:hypothetical protein